MKLKAFISQAQEKVRSGFTWAVLFALGQSRGYPKPR